MTAQTTTQTTTDVNTTDVTAIVREKYGEAARRVLTGTGTASCGTSPSADSCGCGCEGSSFVLRQLHPEHSLSDSLHAQIESQHATEAQ